MDSTPYTNTCPGLPGEVVMQQAQNGLLEQLCTQPPPPLIPAYQPPRNPYPLADHKQALVNRISERLGAYFEGRTFQLYHTGSRLPYTQAIDLGQYQLMVDGKPAAHWSLAGFPGCCGICVSTEAAVHHPFAKKGLGTLLNALRIDWARTLGYGTLLCTDIAKNLPQRKVLAINGWKDVHSFINPRTSNEVIISVFDLKR